jgi:hypothetical protein
MSSAHDEVERAVAVARVGKLIFGEEMSAASIIDENLARATDPRIAWDARSKTWSWHLRQKH